MKALLLFHLRIPFPFCVKYFPFENSRDGLPHERRSHKGYDLERYELKAN